MSRSNHYLRLSTACAMASMFALVAHDANAAARPKTPVSSSQNRKGARVAQLPVGTQRPTTEVVLSVGRGQLVTLPTDIVDVWTSNESVADVYVSTARQIHLFGKSAGEATVFATTRTGAVVYATNVRVGSNVNSLDQMLRLAMPDAKITATSMNGLVLLTGTIAAPDDGAEAERLVKALVGESVEVVSRLRSATPLQVMLQVKIAEVSRSLAKSINSNLTTRDTSDGFGFSLGQGRNFGTIGGAPGTPSLQISNVGGGKTTLGALGRLFGLDVAAALDIAEQNGMVSLLAEPNLTALSGETASFLAGGEFPIPISQSLGQVTVEYKQYGVSLSFTPTVLADGRISMRVRPEVSQLTGEGAVTLNGFAVPAISTRRTETTVELGSGQSFMIGGLLQNSNSNSMDKTPGLGDVPVLGALFRSNGYRRNQTELMIIVTPYLVKPVSANAIALPTDGLKTPNDLQTFLLGQDFTGKTGGQRPKPTMAPPVTVPAPSIGSPLSVAPLKRPATARRPTPGAMPGFSN